MRFLWSVYIIIGLGAFAISFLLEAYVFLDITSRLYFAFAATAVFESAKVMTIIMHRFLDDRKAQPIPGAVKVLTHVFKISLVVLSLFCSVSMLSGYLEGPKRETTRQNDLEMTSRLFEKKRAVLKEKYENQTRAALDRIENKFRRRHQHLKAYYEPRIQKVETLRDNEFKNVVGGVRKGPNWIEHARQTKALKKDYYDSLKAHHAEETEEMENRRQSLETFLNNELQALSGNYQKRMTAIAADVYEKDVRVLNTMVSAVLKTFKNGFGLEISYLKFVIVFSVMISFLLESTIYIVFNYLVITHHSIFALQHDLNIGRKAAKEKVSPQFELEK